YKTVFFFFSSRRRHTRSKRDWSSDVCSSDLYLDDQYVDDIFVEQEVTSTQHLAKQYLTTHQVQKPIIFAAESQSNGYGRRGRAFYSPATSGLYFTIVLPNKTEDWSQVGLLTTSMAVIIAQTLEQFFPDERIDLKWVNDLFINDKK